MRARVRSGAGHESLDDGARPAAGFFAEVYKSGQGDLRDGVLRYAGRVGTGVTVAELGRLAQRLKPLEIRTMPLDAPPPREARFGSPLELSRVHWVKPELVVEVTYLSWTGDNLLRQVSYQGLREDKPIRQVVRKVPYPREP